MNKCLSVDQCKKVMNEGDQVIVPVSIVMQMHRDKRLSANASIIWQIIYIKCYRSENWTAFMTIEELANSIDKSPRTIKRIIKELEEADYLNHNRLLSRFMVFFPEDFQEREAIEEHRGELILCTK